MSPLYLFNGKLLVRDGALATNSGCCCTKYYCYRSKDPVDCTTYGCYGSNGQVDGYRIICDTGNPIGLINVFSTGIEFSTNIACDPNSCNATPYGQVTINIPENAPSPAIINITGSVDDELIVDGQVIEAGQHLGGPCFQGIPECEDVCNQCNGAHDVDYTFETSNSSFTVAVGDNHGYVAAYSLSISIGGIGTGNWIQISGPHDTCLPCSGYFDQTCACPTITGTWYLEGWDLGICETPSGLCVLENSNCNDSTSSPPYYIPAGCYRSLVIYDYPVSIEGGPRGWNEGNQGTGFIDANLHISMPSCVEANDFIVSSSRWEFDVCGELAESGYYIPPIDGESFIFGKCTEPSNSIPFSGTGICCDTNVYCYECFLSNSSTIINNNPGNEPWRNCDLNIGTKFIGEGDWTNYKNWADANNNTPAVASAGADIITGQVRSTRGGWPSFDTLAGTIEIGFECGNMVVDGGSIVGGGFCQSVPPSPRTCTTFEFKNGGSISDVTLVSTGGGVLNTNSVINNGGEINTPSITINNSTNDGVISGLTSAAIFSGNSTNSNSGSVEGDAEFQGTAINNGLINGNATFKSGTKNYGTINGNATFEPGSCNSGTVAGTITGSPPAC